MHNTTTAVRKAIGRLTQRTPQEDQALYPPPELRKDEIIGYLYRIAFNDPCRWVCEACLQLHPIAQTDSLITPANTTCPHDREQLSEAELASRSTPMWRIFPRHVKMTLKYTRLDSKGSLDRAQRQHLQLLLATQYHSSHESGPSKDFPNEPRTKSWLIVQPYICEGTYWCKGRFWFPKSHLGRPISTRTLRNLKICGHQFFDFDVPDWRERPMSLLCMLVEQALETKDGRRLEGKCEWCGTKFIIRHDDKGFKIDFYKLIGREAWFENGLCMCDPCRVDRGDR